ncbi:catechol 1,2-dioxygenase [Haliscomenobacter sp.]|uniref:dioxygenase family protein n=1 Tax=Haliscomenobacter sp. TaxID=2717303 RepID=UPI003364FC09
MQRRTFIKNTALSAIAISATGFVHFDGQRYVGDCATTSDILGPFYRPNSPVRNLLAIKGEKGDPITLLGKVLHDDCSTPYKKAKIELWHCDGNGVYDNESQDFKYRGTTYSDDKGNYSFKTILPVPYDAGGGNIRPAHFHMMITAAGYQPLVTQLYFSGDPRLAEDDSSSSPAAKKRILEVQNLTGGSKKVQYNISMAKKLAIEPASMGLLVGNYIAENDPSNKMELFRKDKQLWIKGDKTNGMPYGLNFEFVGDNTFTFPGTTLEEYSAVFEIGDYGKITMRETYANDKGEKIVVVYKRVMK